MGIATPQRHWRSSAVRFLERNSLCYKLVLVLKGSRLRPQPPDVPWMNSALRHTCDCDAALTELKRIGLYPQGNIPKNWDALAALDLILTHTTRDAAILDAGGEIYSSLMQWLLLYGYRDLHVINLAFKKPFHRGPIRYISGDCTRTPYADRYFDVITCMSVLEHGVPLDQFFGECDRLLKPGGQLIISTDYWQTPIDTSGKRAYGHPVEIFTEPQVRAMIDLAKERGFVPTGPVDYTCGEKVVHWQEVDLDYTFIVFALTKSA